MTKNSAIFKETCNMLLESKMFNHLPSAELTTAARYFTIDGYTKGQTIFKEGDMGSFMCIVHEGRVSIIKTDKDLNEVVMGAERAGRAFGEMAVIDGERRSATCVADTDCTLLTIAKSQLAKMIDEEPRVGAKILSAIAVSLSQRMRATAGRLVDYLD